MKIISFEKKLNNTELGKGGTHDTYVLVPIEVDVSDLFEVPGQEVEFKDMHSGETIILRNTVDREKRIVGLGEYYRVKDLNAGDDIIFERRILDTKDDFLLRVRKYSDIIVAQKNRYGFEILTSERWNLIDEWTRCTNNSFSVTLKDSRKKRTDSPKVTDFYDIKINGLSILESYKNKEMLIITFEKEQVVAHSFCNWKKSSFDVEV